MVKRKRGNQSGPNSTRKYETEEEEISHLKARIKEETPARGYAPPLSQKVSFRSLPLSEATLRGLEGDSYNMSYSAKQKQKKSFVTMTDIQNTCIPHALAGRDILGAAKTGSGKTLAFLVPTLEQLYRARFHPQMGPGAIILSPTRELSIQIFAVLRSIGSHHNVSAGLLTGGKREFRTEQTHVGRTNIIVATPGRLLQHLEQTPNFDVSEVCVLVLDEADRILDMGFRDQLKRILDYLPTRSRQTMLFSATQTKNVKDLARLSFREKPEYLFVHDHEVSDKKGNSGKDGGSEKDKIAPTPDTLKEQNVMVVPLEHKMNMIYSFLKSHLNKKIIIFFNSCAQVRHVHAIFCALQPGMPIMALHGKIAQHKRTKIYFDFCDRGNVSKKSKGKNHAPTNTPKGAALFATDLAARGLDFPDVDWVLQADAPEDKETYIHRVGRTARYTSGGRGLLFLQPSEEAGMMKVLTESNIPLKKIAMNPNKAISITPKAASIVASNPPIKELAKKAFTSYLRSIYLMPNKEIFYISDQMDLDAYSTSLGLPMTPSTRFMKQIQNETREEYREKKNVSKKLQRLKEQIKAEKLQKKIAQLNDVDAAKLKKKLEQQEKKKNNDEDEDEDSDDDGLLVVKQKHKWDKEDIKANDKNGSDKESSDDEDDSSSSEEESIPGGDVISSKGPKRIRIEGSSTYENKRITFDDDGVEKDLPKDIGSALAEKSSGKFDASNKDALVSANEEYMKQVKERLAATRELDNKEEKERIRAKRMKQKMRDREDNDDDDDDGEEGDVVVTLGGADDDMVDNEGVSAEEDGSESESESSDSDDDDDSDSDDEVDIKAQEDLALSLMRKNR